MRNGARFRDPNDECQICICEVSEYYKTVRTVKIKEKNFALNIVALRAKEFFKQLVSVLC